MSDNVKIQRMFMVLVNLSGKKTVTGTFSSWFAVLLNYERLTNYLGHQIYQLAPST